ncbi:NAD+ diphosphatase [Nitzschia inconspicua]|uniref:NAD+ diphosphatase n=1 Tax=Nitzschia inconspicua TaxID=303405 RepID=A0A9K3Q6I7_9STRA|nr:NAD+ diphosphatase [Nitzschia inconspicua]
MTPRPVESSISSAATPQPWYSHPNLERDRSHVVAFPCTIEDLLENSDLDWSASRFILLHNQGMWYRVQPSVGPLFLKYQELKDILKRTSASNATNGENKDARKSVVAWVGRYQDIDYWVAYTPDSVKVLEEGNQTKVDSSSIDFKALREFGDALESQEDAGILATAQGLVEFHKSHPFCSLCGGATQPVKAGACRKCADCRKSVYPRLDVASIMLITSPCHQHALLGRKKSWPAGRYSTLAGFCEVGETLEDCCCRETYEESGVEVDPSSVKFVASQPWPFPRSLMVGFRATATTTSSSQEGELPNIAVDTSEMEDIRWFAKDFVRTRLEGGSAALAYEPNGKEADFHIPGKSSLARLLITQWTIET